MAEFQALIDDFGLATLVAIAIAAIITSSIHGAIGLAGGLLMTATLALLIGVRASVPVMSIALIFSHGSRSLIYLKWFDWRAFLTVILAATPFIIMTGYIYAILPVRVLATVLAVIIFTMIPLRHWAAARSIRAGTGLLAGAGAVYGFFAGASIGSATILSPFLLGYGLFKEAFVATMAGISLSTNAIRIGVFTGVDLMNPQYVLLGVLVGLIMIPGNYIGRTILRRISITHHGLLVDLMAALGGLNFLYLAIRG
ncbi:MAG: sulfolactate exporter TauE [Rhodobacteraceae bacterium HLUCCA08]|nr:MAG: sulfolactate exporter TauE [Rhodobacteraceae bacterium HLUCCA08]